MSQTTAKPGDLSSSQLVFIVIEMDIRSRGQRFLCTATKAAIAGLNLSNLPPRIIIHITTYKTINYEQLVLSTKISRYSQLTK